MAVYKYGQAAKNALPTATTATAEQTAAPQQDNGGFLGGIGYVAEKAGLGFLSTFEGVWDYAAGGIASMFGNNEWSEQQFKNDWVDYSHPDTWYQPSEGLKVAGDVFSGIGNSAANLVPYGIAAAITYFSGGTLAPVAAAIVKGGAIGSSIALAGVGAAGQSTKQAYQETGKLGQAEYGYGAMSGATEGLLEGATNLIGFGSGAVAKSLSRAAAKEAAETVAKETIGKTLIKGFAGEAFEEGMSAFLEPQYAKLTYDPNAQNATAQEIAYSAFVGGLAGMVMGGTASVAEKVATRVQDRKTGEELVAQGKDASILEMAREVAETERNTPTGDHAFEYTKEAYDKLMQSLATTGGKVTDASQKRMLGEVARWSAFSAFSPMISKSAANIYQNAEAYAERLNAYYSSVGGNMSVTAEEIRNGLDPKDPKTFKTALETNPTLRMLAIADATGHLFLDSTRFAQAAAEGRGIATQDDINRLLETADEAKINALSQRYGVDLRTATASEFNKAVTNYMQNGGYDTEMGEVRRSKAAKGADEKTAKTKLPKAIALKDGETVRYKIGDEDFSITREGDGYYLHDNKTDRTTRKLTKAEVNKRLADYRQQAELSKPDTGDNEQKKTAETVDAWAGENVIGYNKLGNADKVGIRRLINTARAMGVSDADIVIYASISARSGVKITFENKPDADYKGYYSHKDNLITINLAKATSAESTIIHEFDHAIRTVDGDFYIPVKEAADALTDAEFMQVMEAYSNETAMGKADELTAHGAEKLLAGQGVLTRLMDEQPKLLDRVLAFFKGAASDYKALPRLSKEAKRYYKKYKKMFDALSFRNAGGYVTPGDAVDFRYNRAAVDTHQKALKQKYNEKTSPVPLEKLLKGYERIVTMWDRIGSELNSEFLNRWNERKQDKAFTIFKKQSGYTYNVELSSMCKKGIPLFEAIDTIVRDEAMAKHGINQLGKAEKEVLYDVLQKHDFEIPCAICYVEQARQRENIVIADFADGDASKGKLGWNQALTAVEERMSQKLGRKFKFGSFDQSIGTDAYDPTDVILTEEEQKAFCEALAEEAMVAIEKRNAESEEYNKKHKTKPRKILPNKVTAEGVRRYFEAKTATAREAARKAIFGGSLPANVKIFSVLMQDPNARRHISAKLLYSSRTTRNLAVYTPFFYSLFNSQGGTAGYKTKQAAIAYWGELLGQKWASAKTREHGGIRNQSNSDFQAYQFLDYVQMYIDLTAKGFYLQAYTKSVAELKLFGKSRSKMNASLIPAVHRYYNADGTINEELTRENAGLDENGNPIYDDVEGINHTEAFALIRDPEYSKNITGICIGYSDKHILKLLDIAEVQMIIGYHDKTNDPTKRYRGAVYATNYTGRNEAAKQGEEIVSEIDTESVDEDDGGKKVKHINFTQFIIQAEDLFKAAKQYDSKTDTYRGSIEHNGKTYKADDIPKLAADLYRAYCESHGLAPAYSRGGYDFSTHPNYYKLLADYGLKDSEGHYAPHRKVAFSLPDTVPVLSADGTVSQMGTQEYLKAQLQSELEVRDRIARDLADTSEQGIIPQFVKGVKQLRQEQSYGVRKSKVLTDSQGNPITEAQADYFKDSLVRDKNGNLKVVYHGSGSQFTVFSHRFIGRHGSSEGQGFYFTDSENLASGYAKEGGQLLRGYLDIKKPLYDDKVTLTRAQIDKLIRKIDPTGDDLVANYDSQGGVGYPSRIWYERSVRDTVRAVMQYAESDSEILAELANSSGDAEKVLTEARRMFGYDGYIAHGHFGDATVYVAFTSEQFKNADNETPTSDPDIRKSKVLPSDTEYLAAVERGDMETAQRMVDEAARRAGYDVTTYHGTDKEFTVFKTLYRNEFGYHTGTRKAAEDRVQYQLNAKVLKLYTNLGKTIRTPDVFGYFAGMHDYIFYVRGETDKVSDMDFLKQYGRTKKLKNTFPSNDTLNRLHNAYVEFVESGYKGSKANAVVELTQEYLRSIGVDSIAYTNAYESAGSTSYLLMDSNRVKSADPVTYDDNGNIIPLSERFNAEESDIRYSRSYDLDGQVGMFDEPTVSREQSIAADFVEHMRGVVKANGGWTRDDAYAYVDGHPELNFIERIHAKDKTAKSDLEAFLSQIEDYDTLDLLDWYLGRAYSGAIRVRGETGYSRSPYRGAVSTFRNAVRRRMNEIASAKVGGSDLGIENGVVSLADAKELFDRLNKNEEIGAFAERVFATAEKLGVNIRFTNAVRSGYAGQAVGDMVEYKTSYFNDKAHTDQEKASTILHELIHSCTSYAFRMRENGYESRLTTEMNNALRGFGKIFGEIESDKAFEGQYGVTNAEEMVAELSNPEFVALMKKKTLWDRILDFLAQFFGFKRGNSAYDGARVCLDYMLDNPDVETYRRVAYTVRKALDRNGQERFGRTVMPDGSVRYSRPVESATIDGVMTSVDEGYKAGKMETLRDTAIATQIAITNAQAGIEAYGKKHGIKDIEARVQAVRSAQGQAGEMIGGNQYRIGGATNEEKVYLGQGLQEIMRPINDYGKGQKVSKNELKEMREEYKREFFDYLFNHLNVDRMTLESRSMDEQKARLEAQKVADADVKSLTRRYKQILAKIGKLGRTKTELAEKKTLRAEAKDLAAQIRKLQKDMKERQKEIEAFEPRQNKPVLRKDNGSGGFTEVSADESREQIKKYDKERPEFKEIAEKLWAFLRNLNQYRVDTGLLSQDTADLLADLYAHYVPSYRADAKVGIAAIDGKRILGVRQTIKVAKGSLKDLLPIDVMIARQVEETVRAGRINQLANILYETAIDGETDEIQILSKDKVTTEEMAEFDPTSMRPKDGQITFYRDGEKIVMRVSKEIFAGFDAFTPQIDSKNPLANTLTAINNAFKKLVTSMNPAFLARNTIRDIQDAGINTKYPKTFVQNYARAAQEIMNDGELWRLYRAFGGYSSSIFDFDSGMQGHQNRFGFTQVEGNLLQRGITAIENANAFTEQLPRFAEFISAIEAGKSVEQAILDAADVTTNFGRSGRVTQVLNRTLVPFLNPSIQGFSKMIRNVTSIRTAREFGSFALKVTLIGLLPQAINMLMYGGDDDYEELKDTDKENNFLFKVGDKFVKLPRGRVAAALGGLVNRSASAVKGEDADWVGYVENVFQQVTPVDSMSRDIFSPFRDVQFNTTWYGSPIEGRQFDNTAPKDRYDESTSSIAKAISDGLHAIGLGFGISPKKVHYLLDQYSGVIGDFVLPATTAKPERDFLSGNFTIDPVASNELSTKFYKLYDEAVYARTDGDDTATYQVRYLTKVKNAISDMYDRKREIERSNLSDKEKQAETRVIQILINEAYRTALADYSLYTDAIKATSGIEDANIRFAEATRLVYGAERALKDYDGEVYKRASALKAAGVDYDTYYSYYFSTKDIEADKDIRGNDISGSKRKKVVSTITAMKVPKEQKMILINAAGYSVKDGDIPGVKASTAKGILWRYIRNAKGLTEEQMEILARVCGFSVKNGKIVMNG